MDQPRSPFACPCGRVHPEGINAKPCAYMLLEQEVRAAVRKDLVEELLHKKKGTPWVSMSKKKPKKRNAEIK
jgi:hypothetical protein